MMYPTEQEQIAQIKGFISLYLKPLLFTILFILSGYYAWHHRQDLKIQEHQKASILYQSMLGQADLDEKKLWLEAKVLQEKFEDTVYADFAALFLAKHHVTQGDFKRAEQQLKSVVAHHRPIENIARLRLARVLIAEKKTTEARTVLQAVKGEVYSPAVQFIQKTIQAVTHPVSDPSLHTSSGKATS